MQAQSIAHVYKAFVFVKKLLRMCTKLAHVQFAQLQYDKLYVNTTTISFHLEILELEKVSRRRHLKW